MLPSNMFLQAGLGTRKRRSEPGLWPWPSCSAQRCPCPRDTTGHKTGIDLQPSGDAGYLNATRNYESPILYRETSLPPFRSQIKKTCENLSWKHKSIPIITKICILLPVCFKPSERTNKQTNIHPPPLQVHKTYYLASCLSICRAFK